MSATGSIQSSIGANAFENATATQQAWEAKQFSAENMKAATEIGKYNLATDTATKTISSAFQNGKSIQF